MGWQGREDATKEKVFEIDTSDQMVIPSLWASSIGLHLINIAASGLRPPAAAPPKPRGDFLQLTSMTIFFYRRAAEARATIWRRSRRHLLAIGTKKSRKKKGESQDIRWHSQALNPLCMFAVTTAGDWRWLSHISSQPKPNVQFRGVGTFLAGGAFDH